jgi:hypothetical protein
MCLNNQIRGNPHSSFNNGKKRQSQSLVLSPLHLCPQLLYSYCSFGNRLDKRTMPAHAGEGLQSWLLYSCLQAFPPACSSLNSGHPASCSSVVLKQHNCVYNPYGKIDIGRIQTGTPPSKNRGTTYRYAHAQQKPSGSPTFLCVDMPFRICGLDEGAVAEKKVVSRPSPLGSSPVEQNSPPQECRLLA